MKAGNVISHRDHLIYASILFISLACNPETPSEIFQSSGIAINGYDPVAYFTEGMPVKGDSLYVFHWKGAVWRFSNDEHLKMFGADPEKYAPQFGGYCAYGMYEGHKAKTEPDTWTIVDDKLYLNYNMNVRDLWRENRGEHIRIAETNWPEVKNQEF
ncbi:MAG TPA: YHS domain-containing (seleno)protein [Cyclobacteriaceae bacterium]|nr:YHS domain-containing (seleno)protein [Cyclobacteriaceae bacterium]